jgi:NTE family protein
MFRRPVFFMLLGLLLAPALIYCQQNSGQRPKIGYVFSGGGAKGMAHVGVLKVLEEVGLQPDYITGTSMGSIVGGLYSIGYSAEELDHIVEQDNWVQVLTNQISSNKVLMRRKHEYSRFALEMNVYDGKLELPSGVIEGQKISELFSELSWRQAGVDDFNDFPVPFACIGTDILKGEKVLLNSGDLSSAMRASMAIPSVFSAVIRDSIHLLVDGGVIRNFPVQEAFDMGADIIIGVYVGFDSHMTPEQLRSLTSVITRTSLLAGAHDVESQVPLVDYMIVPDLTGYTPASFTNGVEIMQRGEEAARAQIDVLRALSDSINNLGAPPEIKHLPDNDSLLISDIKVLSESESMSHFIVEKSGIETGSYINPDQLNESINKLFGTLFFDKIEYYFEDMDEGKRLVFRIKEKAPASIRAAVHYDNVFGPGLLLNYTRLNSLVDGSRLGITVDVSGAPQIRTYYDIHLGKKRNFIGSLFVNGERERLPFYSHDVDIGNYGHSIMWGGLGFRQTLGTNNHIGADVYYRHATLKLSQNIKEVQPDLNYLNNIIFKGMEINFVYQFNSFDNNLYPTMGSSLDISYRQSLTTTDTWKFSWPDTVDSEDRISNINDPYWHLTAALENYFPMGGKLSLNSGLGLGISDDDKPFTDNYYVGGYRYNLRQSQVAFVGLHSHELLQGNYLGGKLALQWEPIPGTFISALANIIFVSDVLNEFPDDILNWVDEARYIGAGLGFTMKTPIGPISVYYGSRVDTWNPIWYTNIGFTF